MRACGPSPSLLASHAAMCARRGAQPALVCGQPGREPPPAACLRRRSTRSTPPPQAATAGTPPRAPRLLPPPGVAPVVQALEAGIAFLPVTKGTLGYLPEATNLGVM
ncbi:polyketide biosynthesis protein ThaF-like [Psammomys obesus]|uniref:polyketide biosynthesis protein ThaF-like n=1 Tax=Psammomys obesus TaxID=48139 RepID=UPI002452D3AA|nr:polyketide biosynthesis protein ThaF-like [Psammomys obesus]